MLGYTSLHKLRVDSIEHPMLKYIQRVIRCNLIFIQMRGQGEYVKGKKKKGLTTVHGKESRYFHASALNIAIRASYRTETTGAKRSLEKDEQGMGDCCSCQSFSYSYGY